MTETNAKFTIIIEVNGEKSVFFFPTESAHIGELLERYSVDDMLGIYLAQVDSVLRENK